MRALALTVLLLATNAYAAEDLDALYDRDSRVCGAQHIKDREGVSMLDPQREVVWKKYRECMKEVKERDAERREAAEKARLAKGGVRIGMNKKQVLASSWGKPNEVNTTTTAHKTMEQWVYGGYNFLYFENSVLTAIQN